MPTSAQIRAARGLLNWKKEDLAKAAGISMQTIRNAEQDSSKPHIKTLSKIVKTFEQEGVLFNKTGVQLGYLREYDQNIKTLTGRITPHPPESKD